MLKAILRKTIITVVTLFVIVTAIAFVIRVNRYPDDWRLCSDIGAYHFDYQNERMIFDDGIAADQAFEMQKCADDISLRHCSISVLDFVNPQHVSGDSVALDFSLDRRNNETVVIIPQNNSDMETSSTRLIFYENGSFIRLFAERNGALESFEECEFPLFR